MALQVGDSAPGFDLEAVQGDSTLRVRLSDYLGKSRLLVTFHPVDWTPT